MSSGAFYEYTSSLCTYVCVNIPKWGILQILLYLLPLIRRDPTVSKAIIANHIPIYSLFDAVNKGNLISFEAYGSIYCRGDNPDRLARKSLGQHERLGPDLCVDNKNPPPKE